MTAMRTKPVVIKISYVSGQKLKFGEEERRRYASLECALDDCLIRSSTNKAIVEKAFVKSSDDPYDYYIQIYD